MLRKVRFKNFKSFTKETVIDLNKSEIQILEDVNTNNNCLKGCCFYGANASGKTNALSAIYLIKKMLIDDYKFEKRLITLFNNDETAFFEYTYKIDNKNIVYYFEVNRNGEIIKETMEIDGVLVINRLLNTVESKITKKEKFINDDNIKSDILFLRNVYFNVGFEMFPILDKLFNTYKNSCQISPSTIVLKDILTNNKEETLKEYLDKYGDKEINDFLTEFNFPYTISYKKTDEDKYLMLSENSFRLIRKNMTPIPFMMESYGNKVFISMLPKILNAVNSNGMLFIDEFSSGLHNQLEELLIKYINKNSKECQLFFVSHSTNLLKTSLLRPDQIYAVSFGDAGSYITKFSDEHPRESQDLEKMYLSGVFKGIPLYDKISFK